VTRLRLGFLALLLLPACSTVAYAPLHDPPRPLSVRAPATVQVFAATTPPPPYVVIGTLETEPSRQRVAELTPRLVGELRREAAHAGCDALVLRDKRTSLLPTGYGFAYEATSYRADCVVFGAFSAATASR